ncbi:MAG: hypothetical protein IPK10_16825 [Bacteroidetes bacterium]|nr:hypothetical protein [Bacteroidota bacterium]
MTGASVNTVHGNAEHIAQFKKRSAAQVESMEGAAFSMPVQWPELLRYKFVQFPIM